MIDNWRGDETRDERSSMMKGIVQLLTPYATAFRYPSDVLEPDPQDAEEALVSAENAFCSGETS